MAKLLLPILLVLVSGACCQENGPPGGMPEPTGAGSGEPTSVVLPSTAPTFGYNYTDPKKSSQICIRMDAGLGLNVTYADKSGKEMNVIFNIGEPATIAENSSYCNHSVSGQNGILASVLALTWRYDESDVDNYTLTFYLKANENSGKEQWNVTSVDATIPVKNNEDLPDPQNSVDTVSASYADLVESLDFTRSYFCNTSRLLEMTVNTSSYNVSLNITGFQIQAFGFSDTYEYGSAVRCSQDIKGSKIVPIIVGAALAGLVIIVLIAYIIGRYRSRKQNSYEALS